MCVQRESELVGVSELLTCAALVETRKCAHLSDNIPLVAELILPHEVGLFKLHLSQDRHVGVDPDPQQRGVSTAGVMKGSKGGVSLRGGAQKNKRC